MPAKRNPPPLYQMKKKLSPQRVSTALRTPSCHYLSMGRALQQGLRNLAFFGISFSWGSSPLSTGACKFCALVKLVRPNNPRLPIANPEAKPPGSGPEQLLLWLPARPCISLSRRRHKRPAPPRALEVCGPQEWVGKQAADLASRYTACPST